MKDKHKTVLELRKTGMTYPKISKIVNLSESTISFILTKYTNKTENEHITAINNQKARKAGASNTNRSKAMKEYHENKRQNAYQEWRRKLEQANNQNFVAYIAGLY